MAAYQPQDSEFPESLKSERILLASESLGPINGVSRTNTNLILSLQEQGVQMKLVAPNYQNSNKRALPYGEVKRLSGASLPYTPELTVAFPFRLDKLCYSIKPSLIYLASPASVGFQILLQLRNMSNPPVVMANFQTDLSAYAKIIFPSPLDSYSVWLLQVVQGWLYNFPAVHTIFYPSTPVRQYLLDAGVPEEKLFHLGRGVDTVLFHPRHRDEAWRTQLAPKGELILVVVGRLAPEKGFPFLARVVTRLGAEGIPFKLIVVGGNRNAAVEADIRTAFDPVAQHVTFTGFLEGERLARAYASADVFAHCSVTETFGLVVLEAMATGVPVIARDEGGPSEIVKQGVSGFLTSPDSEVEFVQRIKDLANNREMRETMAKNARAQAEDSTWEKINLRVAQRMQLALDEWQEKEMKRRRKRKDFGSVGNFFLALGGALMREMLFTFDMVIVWFFWIVAVVPLLVHGNIVFSRARGQKTNKNQETSSATTSLRI